MFFAPLLAIILFTVSKLNLGNAIALAMAGTIAWTLAEYIVHRFVLHRLVSKRHGVHHAKPSERVLSISWQIWACFAVVYWVAGGAFLTGALLAYAWYLFVHHCTHHNAGMLPSFIVRNHNIHHKFANRNYGVTTPLWDHVFGTAVRDL